MKYLSFPIFFFKNERLLCCVSIFIISCNSVRIFWNLKLTAFQNIAHKFVYVLTVSIQTLPDDFNRLKFDRSLWEAYIIRFRDARRPDYWLRNQCNWRRIYVECAEGLECLVSDVSYLKCKVIWPGGVVQWLLWLRLVNWVFRYRDHRTAWQESLTYTQRTYSPSRKLLVWYDDKFPSE